MACPVRIVCASYLADRIDSHCIYNIPDLLHNGPWYTSQAGGRQAQSATARSSVGVGQSIIPLPAGNPTIYPSAAWTTHK